jgi:hypothetical protein
MTHFHSCLPLIAELLTIIMAMLKGKASGSKSREYDIGQSRLLPCFGHRDHLGVMSRACLDWDALYGGALQAREGSQVEGLAGCMMEQMNG